MGISATVVQLAETLETSPRALTSRHVLQLQILKLMPLYSEVLDLPAWECAFQGALEEQDDESPEGIMIWEVFQFGRHNMYCAFNPASTREFYRGLVALLAQHKIVAPKASGFSNW